ncbi:MAG: ATPase, P-type (Transporting), HAD superfamily, subfamily IC [Thermoanaerobacterales bacterium 50_218]|nr:MAG: ATPase, P-type (Transporting), HAD superfamily, subfamily IC [Thermoanaerobacterales bacterium 50_218]HAA90588.1 calcium-translocating P-type ATPase, SERCA-type [Peptococcaceae bacterium]
MHWHTLSSEEVAKLLNTDLEKGLTPQEAEKRLSTYGYNELVEAKKRTPFQMFLDQFKELLVLLLVVAAGISLAIGETLDALVIMTIVVLNAIVGFFQEYRAEKSLEALKKLASPQARVIRGGKPKKVPARQLVPGDLILVEAGDYVPADARLVSCSNLRVDESALTGESEPVEKQTQQLSDQDLGIGDRSNQIFMGTLVTYGNGTAVVVATGMRTEIGKIAEMLEEAPEGKTPLQEKLAELSKWLGGIVVVLCAVIFTTGVLRGTPILEMFLTAVSLAVAAIPEGLPAVVTMVLALGVQQMATRKAIIRRLPAVETLGAATVICSDKTGTLTKNEMTVRYLYVGGRLIKVTGEGYQPQGSFYKNDEKIDNPQEDPDLKVLLSICALTNNAHLNHEVIDGSLQGKWEILGDPTEAALAVLAKKGGLKRETLEVSSPRVGEIPFDSERKLMTTVHPAGSFVKLAGTPYIACTKGAFDVILTKCTHILENGQIAPLTKETSDHLNYLNEMLAAKALRVLGIAFKPLEAFPERLEPAEVEKDMVFVGLVAMIDPPRPEAKRAVETCIRAGIKPVMITGDHKTTAVAIASELGIHDGEGLVLTGAELDRLSDEEFSRLAEKVNVYARVAPRHKVRIVKALKERKYIVAMTGDGVNDAPALKMADIGIAMGITGTDVAKEAADMVLADDNFATIVAAVREGRAIFANIRKVIHYLLSCNSSELLTIFAAIAVGLPAPLLPLQILWVNLITDSLPAFALGNDPPEKELMEQPPRSPEAGIFAGGLGHHIIYQGLFLAALVLTAFWWGYRGDPQTLAHGRTMAFGTLAFVQITHSFNIRHLRHSLFKLGFLSNKLLIGAATVSCGLQLTVMLAPGLQKVFKTVPLTPEQWLLVGSLSLTPLIFEELVKLIKRAF